MSEKENNIIASVEEDGNIPQTLRELGVNRIVKREILKWSSCLGSYGMGGPGFFGLLLNEFESFPEEWLVLTLWGADNWLLLDNRWVSAHPNQYEVQFPLYSNYAEMESVDEVTDKFIGAKIIEASIKKDETIIQIRNKDKKHILQIPADTSKLPKYGGTLKVRKWNDWESHLDAWVISKSGYLEV